MSRAFAGLVRLSLMVLMALGVVAVVIGRWSGGGIRPPIATVREWAPAPNQVLDSTLFAEECGVSRLLDLETGMLDILQTPNTRAIDMISISPWRDVDGQHQLVGRWRGDRGEGPLRLGGALGMMRLTFPEGRVLNRIEFDPVPVAPPCWLPDESDRVVFAAGDGALYLLDLQAASEPALPVTVGRPQPIVWANGRPESDILHIRQPCWPSISVLGGRLVVVLYLREPEQVGPPRLVSQLWWLQLTPDRKAIATAGRLIVPVDPNGSAAEATAGEYAPSVGMTPDGVPILAYLADSDSKRGAFELRTAAILFEGERGDDPASRIPRVQAAATRRMASVSVMATPIFSTDGRWIYLPVRAQAGNVGGVARFAVSSDRPQDVSTVRSVTIPEGRPQPANGASPIKPAPLS